MDPSSTPWRALEDAPARTSAAEQAAAGQTGLPRSAVLAGAGAVLLAVIAFLLALSSGTGGSVLVDATSPANETSPADGLGVPSDGLVGAGGGAPGLVVEVVGAVDKPGVYRLPPGARVGDLIDTAGGYGPRVDTDRASRELNLAAPLHDGDHVRVPSRDDPAGSERPSAAGAAGSGGGGSALVDLNHATAGELDALPGIGPVTAAKILAARDEQPFGSVDDLRTRKLVGEKTFVNLKDLVTVQ